MKKWMYGISAAAMMVAGCAHVQSPEAKKPAGPLKVLAVGNSFSNNATRQLPALAAAAGKDLKVVRASIGGCDFERHVRHAEAYAADPESKEARP